MVVFMPQSPRHLMNRNREEECLQTLARLRSSTIEDIRVRIEFLEIKAQRDFERERLAQKFPQYQDGTFKSNFMMGYNDYLSLITNKGLFKRTVVAVLTMVFQQWNGVGPSEQQLLASKSMLTGSLGQCNSVLRTVYLRWAGSRR